MMIFLYPWLFLLLVLPFIIWFFIKPSETQLTSIRTPLFANWKRLSTQSQTSARSLFWHKLFSFLIWVLLVASIARPQWIDEPIEIPTSGRDLLLSIDISGSMSEEDLKLQGKPVNRLAVVKSVVSEFIKKREGDRIGLVLFGENAYLQTPLTFDLKTVQYMLDETAIGLAGASRTAIGDGIGLSIKRLRERPNKKHILILLTDGSNNSGELDPIEAAKLAKHAEVKIYTIGVGADKELRQSMFFGTTTFNPSRDLDEATLKSVAKITGGRYFRARNTQELAQIYGILDQLEPVEDKPEIYRPVQDWFYKPLMLALCLMLIPMMINLTRTLLTHFKRNSLTPIERDKQ